MGHGKIKAENIGVLTQKNLLTRRVLVEKINSKWNSNKILYIYTTPDFSLKNEMKGVENQLRDGIACAKRFGLTPNEYSEYVYLMRHEEVSIGKILLTLLKKVMDGEVRQIYVRDTKLFTRKHKFLADYVIKFLIIHDVKIYTKKGLKLYDYVDLRQMDDNPFNYFMELLGEIKQTFETVRN